MTNTVPTTDTNRSRSAQRVTQWLAEVNTFFEQDWLRLRDLIMQLEEDNWNDHSPPPASSPPQRVSGKPPAIPVQAVEIDDSADDEDEERVAGSPSRDRLSEIAWQIERRLCTNRPGRK